MTTALLFTLALGAEAQTNFARLRSFGFPMLSPGAHPQAPLTLDHYGAFYGTTSLGGAFDGGTVFKLNSNGAFTVLHRFSGSGGDGANPNGGVVQGTDSRLYGTASAGGTHNAGTLFRLNADGSGYTVLLQFGATGNDAISPGGSLVYSQDGMLYGTTAAGGSAGLGTVFKVSTNGGNYELLHSFTGSGDDGAAPDGGLIQGTDGRLYGVTYSGGSSNAGTVFKLDTNGGGYAVLHSFGASPDDGLGPRSGLIRGHDGALYGITVNGGAHQAGTLYKLNPDGTSYALLYHFGALDGDGLYPVGGLAQGADDALYGTTTSGGSEDLSGSIFKISTNGTDYVQLYTFSEEEGDAGNPQAAFALAGDGALYGTTYDGGAFGDGTAIRLGADGSSETVVFSFARGGGDGAVPNGLVLGQNAELYGTTFKGGEEGAGSVFKLSTNGAGYAILRSFTDSDGDGAEPLAGLVQVGTGALYGTTSKGGAEDYGTVFKLNPDGSGYQVIYSFTGTNGGPVNPSAPMVQGRDGALYGTTAYGGAGGAGAVFKLNPDGAGFSVLHSFLGADGTGPSGILQGDDGLLYGTTRFGGALGNGTVFQLDTNGAGYLVLHSFGGVAGEGTGPEAGLAQGADRALYGTTFYGGTNELGTVFKLNRDGGRYEVLHRFTGLDGEGGNPQAALIQGPDGALYGTTPSDDTHPGTVFKLQPDGSGFQVLQTFTGDAGEESSPQAGLVQGIDGAFYGTTSAGGDLEQGTVFKLFSTCAYTISPASAAVGADASAGSFAVMASVGCSWAATTTNDWIHTSAGGDGDGQVTYAVDANLAGSARVGFMAVDGQTFTVTQAPRTYTVTTTSSPAGGGTTTGGGVFAAGITQTVTAAANSGYLFVNWAEEATTLSSQETFTFTVDRDRNLVAHFVAKPFVPAKGSYSGLFYEAAQVSSRSAGAFALRTTAKGSFSGNLRLGRARFSFSGRFDAQRQAEVQIARHGLSSLNVVLNMEVSDENERISGTVSDGTWTADLSGDRLLFDARTSPAPQAGRYTLSIPGQPLSETEPGGDGYGTISVAASGTVRLAGSLADGTKLSQGAALSRTGRWPLFVPLYHGDGLILAWMKFAATADSDLRGHLTWIKPAIRTARFYPQGFTVQQQASGSRYNRPARGDRVMDFSNGQLDLHGSDWNLDITRPVLLGAEGRVTSLGGEKLNLRIRLSTGFFSGSLTDPGASRRIPVAGVVLQKQNLGRGYFAGPHQTGNVLLGPVP